MISWEETKVKGWVGDDIPLGSLSHRGHNLVSQPEYIIKLFKVKAKYLKVTDKQTIEERSCGPN